MAPHQAKHWPLLIQTFLNYKVESILILISQAFTAAVALCFFIFFGYPAITNSKNTQSFHQNITNVLFLEERISFDVQNYISTGNSYWISERQVVLGELNQNLNNLEKLCSKVENCEVQVLKSLIDQQIVIEKKSIELMEKGESDAASKLIFGTEYLNRKRELRSVIKASDEKMRTILAEQILLYQKRRTFLAIAMAIATPLYWITFIALFCLLSKHYRRLINKLELAVSTISHQLRAPVSSMMSYSQILIEETDGPLNEGQKENVHRIQHGGNAALKTIGSILDFSRAQRNALELNIEESDIVTLVKNVAQQFEPLCKEKNLEFIQELPSEACMLSIDVGRIIDVISILLENAIKFTDTGKISIRAEKQNENFAIHIQDSGPGLSEKEMSAIFEPYVQLGKNEKEKGSGIGIGLALAQQIVKLHGGKILIQSEVKVGSTFSVLLPLPGNKS